MTVTHDEVCSAYLIVDRYGRSFGNLRVSLTSACNYACSYCVPDGQRLLKTRDELTGAQLQRAIHLLLAVVDIDKIRITGGEPLVSAKFDDFLLAISGLVRDISITTNGQLLLRKLPVIRESGIKRINVSLDSLDPLRFRRLARGGKLDVVLQGIDVMLDLGLKVKVNMVPLRDSNAEEIPEMLEYCLQRNIELRFIELMRMGHLAHSAAFSRLLFPMDEILELVGRHHVFRRLPSPPDSTAVRFAIPGRGCFGIIANESEPFCAGCNRLRLSSNGWLYGCLSNARSHDMRMLLDKPFQQARLELRQLLQRALEDKQDVRFTGETTVMKFIGG